jgi:hypothetical protein
MTDDNNAITDTEAMKIAKHMFASDIYDAFVETIKEMRELQDCVAHDKPSDRCAFTDPIENLKWCRLRLESVEERFKDVMQCILSTYVELRSLRVALYLETLFTSLDFKPLKTRPRDERPPF